MNGAGWAGGGTPADALDAALAPLLGTRVAGGCDTCDAYQVPHQQEPGIWLVRVHHDDWCPSYRRMRRP